jgi:catechol 2,3-dioxygenase-like lactoylglutathione lyase family enzyme
MRTLGTVIHHVGIEVAPRDLPREVRFWELLGFAPVEPPPALADDFTWLERAGTQIHLMHVASPSVPPRGHVAVVVEDLAAVCAGLGGDGFEVEPGREHWGAPRAKAVSAAGHRVELMAAPPPRGRADGC